MIKINYSTPQEREDAINVKTQQGYILKEDAILTSGKYLIFTLPAAPQPPSLEERISAMEMAMLAQLGL